MRIARSGLFALLGLALLMAGCESAPEVPPPEPPKPETPAPEEPVQGLAWAAGQAPADACLVLTVASMADLETNLKALLGPDGDDMNLVQELDKELVAGGLDAAGPLVFILPAAAEGDPEPVVLLRIKDEAAIKGEKATAGILATEREGATGYVLKMGAWAACADSADAIKAIMRAEKKVALSDAQRAAIAKRMVWVHLNPDSLVAMAKGGIENVKKQMAEAPNAPKAPEATMNMLGALLTLAGDVTRAEAALDVKPTGITADVEAEFDKASDLFALAQSGVPVKDYKPGLPQADGLILAVWAGMDWGKAVPPMKRLMKPIFDIIAEGEDEKTRKAIDSMWASYDKWGAVMGNRFAMVMEQPKPGAGLYQLAETFTIKDPDQYSTLLKEYMETSMEAMDVMMGKFMAMPGVPEVPNVKGKTEYKEAAETVEGVPVDVWRITFDVSLPPDAPPEAAKQLKTMLDTIYGPEGMTFRMALVGNTAIATMGDPGVMARTIKAVKGEAPDLSADPKVAAALKRIPAGEGAALMSAANYMYLAMGMMDTMLTASLPPEIHAEAEKAGIKPLVAPPPTDFITFSGPEGETLRLHVEAPQSDIRAAASVAKQGGERMEWFMKKQQEMAKERQKKAQPAPVASTPAPN
jgi:hypothetical protein